jgi:glycosyltransferase involved in cell wall biosynthesis
MVAPPWFEVPPRSYGGVEAIVADLVDNLVDRGHEITLIGAGKRGTKAQRFLRTYDIAPSARLGDPLPEVLHAARAEEMLDGLNVDIVHDHTLAGPLLARGRFVPTVVTTHGVVHGEAGEYYRALGTSVRLIAISASQRRLSPGLSWAATVHNSVRVASFPFRADKDPFTLFLGRIHPEKAPHLAIDAARRAGLPIVLAGKCTEPVEREYFASEIEPRLGPDARLIGLADAAVKRDLLSRACALLFPICWEEPFGLVMIEAMACGTPVVAFRRGSVPEIVVDGVTGIIADEPAELPAAIERARRLDPAACRAHVQAAFGTSAMATGYEAAYRRVLAPAAALSPAGPAALSMSLLPGLLDSQTGPATILDRPLA